MRFIFVAVVVGKSEGHPAESTLMEIKGYKFAQNKVSCYEMNCYLFKSLLTLCCRINEDLL